MLKAANSGHLVIGLTPKELEYLKAGKPLITSLEDVGYQAVVTILVGDTNEQLKAMMESVNYRKQLRDSVPKLDLSKMKGN
jgi:hypothetical protein